MRNPPWPIFMFLRRFPLVPFWFRAGDLTNGCFINIHLKEKIMKLGKIALAIAFGLAFAGAAQAANPVLSCSNRSIAIKTEDVDTTPDNLWYCHESGPCLVGRLCRSRRLDRFSEFQQSKLQNRWRNGLFQNQIRQIRHDRRGQ